MTVPERVNAFITAHDGLLCDKCIQQRMGLAQSNQVQQIAAALATTPLFIREKGRCSGCHNDKVGTRHA